jgi:hypothetical protein
MKRVISAFCIVAIGVLASSTHAQKISVGSNVNVSASNPNTWHAEIWAGTDPNDPNRLLACSVSQHMPAQHPMGSIFYASMDGGKTWKQTLDVTEGGRRSLDPVCNFGPNHSAYAVVLAVGGMKQATVPPVMTDKTEQTLVYRSNDGGLTWSEPVRLPFIDREDIAVDMTGGKYNGQIYMQGIGDLPQLQEGHSLGGLWFFRSLDGGATFQPAITRTDMLPSFRLEATSNSMVLEDGTVLFPVSIDNWDAVKPGTPPAGHVGVIRSLDGGATLEPIVTIDDYFPEIIPSGAVDRSAGSFKRRVYVSWIAEHDGTHLYIAHSDDNGKTWSGPRRVDDTILSPNVPSGRDDRRNAGLPDELSHTVVDVNKDGVVAVQWYDTRAIPDGRGWDLRMAFSFDGGDTFAPSVRVNSASAHFGDSGAVPVGLSSGVDFFNPAAAAGTRDGVAVPISYGMDGGYFYGDPGHTGAMRASADGVFHAFWVDNHSGISQLYTAPVEVHGEVVRNGSADLASLSDVSDKVSLAIAHEGFDRATGVVTFGIRVRNNSKETIRGPVKLRLVELRGDFGRVTVAGADNNNSGPGAVWDLTSLFENSALGAGQISSEKSVTFKLADPRSVQIGHKGFGSVLVNPTFRLLAGSAGQ